jgi:hypothetical protein
MYYALDQPKFSNFYGPSESSDISETCTVKAIAGVDGCIELTINLIRDRCGSTPTTG